MRFLLITVLTAAFSLMQAQTDPAAIRALVKDSLRFIEPGSGNRNAWEYTVRNTRKEIDSDGRVKSEQSYVGRRTFDGTIGTFRVIERNGKKLTDQELAEQEGRISKHLAEMRAMSAADREAERKKSAENDAWIKEVSEALDFKIAGEEMLEGHPVMILDASPRPGYSPHNMRARVFEKMKGRFWIDKKERQLVKGEAETFDTVSIGFGLLGRIEKGTRFAIHRIRLADGWVIDNQRVRFGARVMLFKWMGNEIDTAMSDFRLVPQQASGAK